MTGAGKPTHVATLDGMPSSWRGAVVAIGNFDGVHRGHQAVLAAARAEAEHMGVACVMLTFEPHPRAFFSGKDVFRLTPAPLKAAAAAALGLDGTLVLPFDAALASQSAEGFVRSMLVDRLAIRAAVTGHDFHFGKARQGTPEYLQREGLFSGFPVTVVQPLTDGPEPVSSTRIRRALAQGDVATANRLLGWSVSFEGTVQHGDARGRTLGYPTANMQLDAAADLAHGIYAVRFLRPDGVLHEGVASYGRRPTFGEGQPLFETFLFDFDGDLYGETALVSLCAFLRGEERFDSAAALIAQMGQDSIAAREILRQRPPSDFETRLREAWTGVTR